MHDLNNPLYLNMFATFLGGELKETGSKSVVKIQSLNVCLVMDTSTLSDHNHKTCDT